MLNPASPPMHPHPAVCEILPNCLSYHYSWVPTQRTPFSAVILVVSEFHKVIQTQGYENNLVLGEHTASKLVVQNCHMAFEWIYYQIGKCLVVQLCTWIKHVLIFILKWKQQGCNQWAALKQLFPMKNNEQKECSTLASCFRQVIKDSFISKLTWMHFYKLSFNW